MTSDVARTIPVDGVDLSSAIGGTLAQLLKRPEIQIEQILEAAGLEAAGGDPQRRAEYKAVETAIKFEGYLQQQERAIERLKKAEQRSIPEWFDYAAVSGLSREMNEKLRRVRPRTLAQASRIPGVTPAAISLINVYLEIQGRRRQTVSA